MRRSTRRRLTAAALVPLAAVSFGACGLTGTRDAPNDFPPPPSSVTTAPAAPGTVAPAGTPTIDPAPAVASRSTAARLLGPVEVRAEPATGADVVASLGERTELGSATTLLVVGHDGDWLQVLLPVRPNGTTGWIPAASAEQRSTDYVITVDLEGRSLTLSQGEAIVVQTPVAVGSPDNPTPPGTYSVTDLLDTGDPNGAYGPFAFGLSGHSETLTEFAGGDGQLGIHGTNDPSSIGNPVSHGCVRVPNDVIAQLVDVVPLGTPVTIV